MRSVLALILCWGLNASAQEIQCVEVPDDHKIVFIPKLIPTSEIMWKWQHAHDVGHVTTSAGRRYEDCSNEELIVSPAVCVKGWVPVEE